MGAKEFPERIQSGGLKVLGAGVIGAIAGSVFNLNWLFGLSTNIAGVGAVVAGTGRALKNLFS